MGQELRKRRIETKRRACNSTGVDELEKAIKNTEQSSMTSKRKSTDKKKRQQHRTQWRGAREYLGLRSGGGPEVLIEDGEVIRDPKKMAECLSRTYIACFFLPMYLHD